MLDEPRLQGDRGPNHLPVVGHPGNDSDSVPELAELRDDRLTSDTGRIGELLLGHLSGVEAKLAHPVRY